MPHVDPLPHDQVPQQVQPIIDALQEQLGSVPNIYRTMAHQPDVLEGATKLDQGSTQDLPRKLRELAYIKTSMVNGCDY